MATMTFAYAYFLSSGSVDYNVRVGSPQENILVDSGTDAELTPGELFTVTLGSGDSYTFKFQGASEDGFIATQSTASGPLDWFATDTERAEGFTPASPDGSFTVCFLAGTMIATPAGAMPVESLAIGDLVLTADGRAAPVRWVGAQTVVTLFADPLRSFPIRIAAGALGEDLPVRDLLVSPDHALMLDGVLVQAGALVNGTTITRETAMPERFTYYHVELDDHSLILAESVPVETFVDNITRRRFDNFAEYEALYGEAGASIAEMDVPRVKSARQLPQALRLWLDALAASGDARDAAAA